jgi:hypothetical protein
MANAITQIILTAVDRTKAAFGSVTAGLRSLGDMAGSLKGLLGGIFASFTVLKLVSGLKSAVDEMDNARKAAQKIGTSVENFTALSFAAGQSGVEVEALQTGLAKLARSLDDAKGGSQTVAEAFARLKIDPNTFTDPSDALLVIADRFKAMPDGVNKTALALQLFGKAGAQLIPLLNAGSAGIAELKAEAEKLGVVISTETAIQAEKFNDNMDRLAKAGKGLGYTLATEALVPLNQIVQAMADAAKQGGLTAAAFALVKELNPFVDFLKNEDMDPIRRLALAEEQLNRLRKDGFDEDNKRVVQLKQMIPLIKVLADEEQRVADAKANDTQATADFAENKKLEIEAFKKATNEQISDTDRLKTAIRTAWEESLKAESDYLAKAKQLRAEAAQTGTKDNSVEGQALATLDLVAAEQKLQRIKKTAPLEDVQAQVEVIKNLVAGMADQVRAQQAINRAKLAEADALDVAAAKQAEQSVGLNEQANEAERRANNMKAALDGIGKEISVDITLSPSTVATMDRVIQFKAILDSIKESGPSVSLGGLDTAKLSEGMRLAALKYGNR